MFSDVRQILRLVGQTTGDEDSLAAYILITLAYGITNTYFVSE